MRRNEDEIKATINRAEKIKEDAVIDSPHQQYMLGWINALRWTLGEVVSF